MQEVTVPELGKIEEMTLTEWKVEEGQNVIKGQELAEVEALKTAFSIDSPADGKFYKKLIEKGGKTGPGEAIAEIEPV